MARYQKFKEEIKAFQETRNLLNETGKHLTEIGYDPDH